MLKFKIIKHCLNIDKSKIFRNTEMTKNTKKLKHKTIENKQKNKKIKKYHQKCEKILKKH